MKALIKTITCSLLLIGGIMSCTEEAPPVPYNIPEYDIIPMDIPMTKAVNDGDDRRIGDVRLIVIKDNVVTNNRLINAKDSTQVRFRELVPVGTVNYYLIANELSSWGLASIQKNDALLPKYIREKILAFNAYPEANTTNKLIPMAQYYEGLTISDNGGKGIAYHQGVNVTDSLGILDRLYAKTSIRLICNFNELQNGGDPIELESISIKQMPKESYLVPDFYTKSALFNGDTTGVIAGSNYVLTGTTPSDGFTGDFSFYIPEHVVSDTTKRSYLSCVVHLINDPSTKREYKISLGDSIDRKDLGALPIVTYMNKYAGYKALRVSRNTHYIITAKITSFDMSSDADIDVTAKIIPWNEGLNVKTEFPMEYYMELTPASDFEFASAVGVFSAVVTIDTNYPDDWEVDSKSHASITTVKNGKKLSFTVPAAVPSGAHWIKIKAGPVIKQIKIKKS